MRKVIDNRGRLFGLVSFIDVVVLLVVALLVSAFFLRSRVDSPFTVVNTHTIEYTVKITPIRESNANLLRVGDRLYSRENGALMGTITNVEITEAFSPGGLLDGEIVMARVQERYTVTLTLEVEASFSNGRFYASRVVELNANAEYHMATRYNDFRGLVTMINTVIVAE